MSLAESFDNHPAGAARSGLAADFDNAESAERLAPIPAGEYQARAVDARLDESRKGTPFFGMRLEIVAGEHTGRRLLAKWYLSGAAMPYSKRDLAALGITSFAMLRQGCVPRGLVRLRVALRAGDDGGQYNEVKAVFPCGEGLQGLTPPEGQKNEASAATPAPAPVAAVTSELPATPVAADELPAGLVDDGLL